MRVGILSQWFDPEPGGASLPGVLARGLVQRGHEVQVVTGYPNYPEGRLYPGFKMSARSDVLQDGFALRRVALYPDHSSRVSGRLANYASFAGSATLFGLGKLRKVDALWVYNSPATVALPMWASQGLGELPTVLHNMDMWPDSVLQAGFLSRGGSRIVERGLEAWVNAMYRSVDLVGYISPSAGEELARRGVPSSKLRFAPVWIDEEIFRPGDGRGLRRELGFETSDVVVSYAGAIGRAQGVGTLVEAVLSLPESLRVKCLVMGSGTEASAIAALARRNPTRVKFIGQVPHRQMTEYAAVSDVCYVGLSDVAESRFTAPSKVLAIMACAKPILAAASGDTADIVTRSATGYVAEPGDASSVASALADASTIGRQGLAAVGSQARKHYEESWSARAGIDRVHEMLEDAVSLRASSSRGIAHTRWRGHG